MPFHRFTSIALFVVVAVLMPCGVEGSDSWEQHVVITPIPLIAEPQGEGSQTAEKNLDSLTGLSEPLSVATPALDFPLSWLQSRSRWDLFVRDIDLHAPVVLRLLFGSTETAAEDWWNAWDKTASIPLEWSPLKLALPVIVDRAVPEQFISHATIAAEDEWFLCRFVLPNKVVRPPPNEHKSVRIEFATITWQETSAWSDALRIYVFSVPAIRAKSAIDARRPRRRVVRHWVRDLHQIEVDAADMSYDIPPIDGTEQSDVRPSPFDNWLGKDAEKENGVFRFGYIGVVR